MRGVFFLCLCICFTLYSCIEEPNYPIIPHIEFKSISSSHIKSGGTDTITFSFTDGDGDLGVTPVAPDTASDECRMKKGDSSELFSNAFNVFMIYSDDSCIDSYASATVQPSGRFKGISGDILVFQRIFNRNCIVPTPGCILDTVIYNVVIRDKAGHLSNFLQLPPIMVDGEP